MEDLTLWDKLVEFLNSNLLTSILLLYVLRDIHLIGDKLYEKLELLQNINNAVWRTADKLNPSKDD